MTAVTPNHPSRVRDEQGFIILGGILLVLLILVIGVMLGKVLRVQYPDSYIEARADRHWVVSDANVQLGGRTVTRLRRGDAVWATRLENGDVAIAHDSTGQKIIGFVGSDVLSNSAPGR